MSMSGLARLGMRGRGDATIRNGFKGKSYPAMLGQFCFVIGRRQLVIPLGLNRCGGILGDDHQA